MTKNGGEDLRSKKEKNADLRLNRKRQYASTHQHDFDDENSC